jgi:hypothetical protein
MLKQIASTAKTVAILVVITGTAVAFRASIALDALK